MLGLFFKQKIMTKKAQLPLRIDEEVKLDLVDLAFNENRSVNNYVETVLKNHIALEKQKCEGKIIRTGELH